MQPAPTYSQLYNLCKSLGFEAGNIMPSRAFCSDESQGYPITLIAKHFGTFPFNHGMVGGVIASLLKEQSEENPDKINLEDAIQQMEKVKEICID